MKMNVDKELIEAIQKDVAEIKDALVGDFEHKGLITRVLTLEKADKNRRKFYTWAGGGIGLIIITQYAPLIFKFFGALSH